jgi:hypothetical protein
VAGLRMVTEMEIRNEEMLLVGLCRLSFNDGQKEKIAELISNVTDWRYFTSLAIDHGIAAFVFHNLTLLGHIQELPDDSASLLRNSHMMSMGRNAFHISIIEELIGLLNESDIKTVLLKGLALEKTIYGNIGLRQMTDVDILIHRHDYIKTRSLLMQNGYDSLPVKSAFHKSIIEWTGKHLPSLMKNGASVDIHLELFGRKSNNLTELLIERAEKIMIDKKVAYVPDPQLHFLFLVRHLYHHEMNNESQLRLYTDLVVLIDKYYTEIINDDLLKYAMQAGITNILAWKLEPLRDLWGLSFPDWINDFIDKWFKPDSINKFVFFLKSPKNNKPEMPGHVYRSNIKEIPGLHRKILFVLGDLFPTISFMKNRYGCKSGLAAFFYYPLRIGKLIWLFRK